VDNGRRGPISRLAVMLTINWRRDNNASSGRKKLILLQKLISKSAVTILQLMLDVCTSFAQEVDMRFSSK